MKLEDRIRRVERKFEKQFVKDLGSRIEPVFRDPVGFVGPIKQFLSTSIREVVEESFEEVGVEEKEFVKLYRKKFDDMDNIRKEVDFAKTDGQTIGYNQANEEREKKEEEYLGE